MTWVPTTEQILDLDGVTRRVDRFRFELCDRELRPIGELHPDRAGSVPTIENDTTGNTHRRMRGFRLMPDEAGDVNTQRDRLRVYMVLQNDVEFRMGTFLWGDVSRPVRSWGSEHQGDLVDLGYILDQKQTSAYGWGKGANIGLVMIFLVLRAGFKLADIAESNAGHATLAEPMSWNPGTTWLTMLTDLGNVLGWVPPWFDRDGKMHMSKPRDPDVDRLTVPAYGPGTRVVADSILDSDDLPSSANDFGVYDSGPDRLRVGRFQLPASAPHSFQNRGYRVAEVQNVQGMETQAQANKNALDLARTAGVAYRWWSFDSTLDPRHDTYDVFECFGKRALEQKWSAELRSGGKMTHTVRQTAYEL